MQSQIGQATQGPMSNPILAAIGKENGNRSNDNAGDRESFQSVLEEASETPKSDQTAPTGENTAEADSETVPADDDATQAPVDEAVPDDEAALEFLANDADELVFKQKTPRRELTSGDVVQLVAEAAEAIKASTTTGSPTASPDSGVPAISKAETATPAWFSTSRATEATGQMVGAKVEAREVLPGAARAATGGEGSGQQIKPEVKGTEKAVLPMAQAVMTDEEPKHVIERRLASEEPMPAFATRRNTASGAAGSQIFAAQLQTATSTKAQNVPLEDQGVRWITEARVTSEAAAQEVPATSRLQQSTLLQQPDLPRNIAVQIAQAMRQGGADKPMELVLSPAELGRVRISMLAGDGAMTVHVMADRPETLDLMRRHIDILAQEFHEIGYGTAEFAFGQNAAENGKQGGDGADTGGLSSPSSQGDIDDTADVAAPAPLPLHSDRVDIRL